MYRISVTLDTSHKIGSQSILAVLVFVRLAPSPLEMEVVLRSLLVKYRVAPLVMEVVRRTFLVTVRVATLVVEAVLGSVRVPRHVPTSHITCTLCGHIIIVNRRSLCTPR